MAKLASRLPFPMIILHSFVLASLTSLPAAAADSAQRLALPHSFSFSFQLHLRHPPTVASSPSLPLLIPQLFSDLPLSALNSRHSYNMSTVASASGLYLYDAASAGLRYFYFTAALADLIPNGAQPGISSRCSAGGGSCSGSLVLMGSVDSGAISVVGGTRDFAFASGQANVTIGGLSPSAAASASASASSDPGQLISFDVELQYEQAHNSIAPLL